MKSHTRQAQHGRVIFAVGDPRGVRDAVLPQVGVVVGRGQHNAPNLGERPVLGGQRGTNQDPTAETAHKAADLHVHHHGPVLCGVHGVPRSGANQTLEELRDQTQRSAAWRAQRV